MEFIVLIMLFIVALVIHNKMTQVEISAKGKIIHKEQGDKKWIEEIFKDVDQEIELYWQSYFAYKYLGSAQGDDLEWWSVAMATNNLPRNSLPLPPLDEDNLRRIETCLNSCVSLNKGEDEIRNEFLEDKRRSLLARARHILSYFDNSQSQVLAGLKKLEHVPIIDRQSSSTWQGDGVGQASCPVSLPSRDERGSLIEFLNSNGINCLYHFTDLSNFESIVKTGGLYSWAHCENNKIKIVRPGGSDLSRDLDTRRGLENYVRMSFVLDHPMLYAAKKDGRLANPIILEIDLEVVLLNSALFSNRNATANDAEIGPGLDDLKKVRFDLIRSGRWASDDEKGLIQAEVLVVHAVPGYLIRRDGRPLRHPTKEEAASLLNFKSGVPSNG